MAINVGSFVGPMIAPLLSGGTSDGVPNLLGYDKRSCGGNAVTIDVCNKIISSMHIFLLGFSETVTIKVFIPIIGQVDSDNGSICKNAV